CTVNESSEWRRWEFHRPYLRVLRAGIPDKASDDFEYSAAGLDLFQKVNMLSSAEGGLELCRTIRTFAENRVLHPEDETVSALTYPIW
ncbi:809_t:CDS:2, partial [Paraglomus occultum]